MNVQVIATPDGDVVCVSGALPGSVHDTKAAWIWQIVAELERSGWIVLVDKGYHGIDGLLAPYKGRGKPESQKQANRAHARLRAPGERQRSAQELLSSTEATLLARTRPDSPPKRFTPSKSANSKPTEDEKGSLMRWRRTQLGLYKTEAIRDDSPFRTGPLQGLADVEQLTSKWAAWYNSSRLMHRRGRRPPVEHEADYYAQVAIEPVG